MKDLFRQEFFKHNRQQLAKTVPNALIFLTANGQLQKNADEGFTFRQDSSFWYFTGLDIADAVLVLNTKNDEELIILPPRASHRDQWEGAIDLTDLSKISGISQIRGDREGWHSAKRWLAEVSHIYSLPPASSRLQRFYGLHPNPARTRLYARLKRLSPNLKIESIRPQVKNLRILKQPVEVEAIKMAIRITEAGFKAVAQKRDMLKHEYEVQAELEAAFKRLGSRGPGFDSVIAGGKNAATLHYRDNNKPIKSNELLLVDAGAQHGYYTADLTRIYEPLDGFSTSQQAHLDAVQRVKTYAESIMKPGIAHREYEKLVHEKMGEELIKLGLIKKSTKQQIKRYFPSLTSHHLGLDTHDIADYDEVFETGMVLTIEPGIYNTDEGIGIRLEDDYVITKTGLINLSKNLPLIL